MQKSENDLVDFEHMLDNLYLLANIGFDKAEPSGVFPVSVC